MGKLMCLFGKHKLKKLFEYYGFCRYGEVSGFQLIEKHICENCTGTFEYAVIEESPDGRDRNKIRCIGLNHITDLE